MTIFKHKEYGTSGSLTANPTSSEWNNMVEMIQDAGSNISTKALNVTSDQNLDLSGGTGSAILKFNTSTNRLEIWVNGNKKMEWS